MNVLQTFDETRSLLTLKSELIICKFNVHSSKQPYSTTTLNDVGTYDSVGAFSFKTVSNLLKIKTDTLKVSLEGTLREHTECERSRFKALELDSVVKLN